MRRIFQCEVHSFRSAHLNQIYDGFHKLAQLGIIDLDIRGTDAAAKKPILSVIIDRKYRVIYDTLDGLNWIEAGLEENLEFFRRMHACDFYFKRSFSDELKRYEPLGCEVLPLGLNYTFSHSGAFYKQASSRLRRFLSWMCARSAEQIVASSFEFLPVPTDQPKAMFLTRLWDPAEATRNDLRIERERLNECRIDCVLACRKEFKGSFLGGLQSTTYSQSLVPELSAPKSITERSSYLKNIRQHDICVATTGLHGSTGWKFGEYVAASRAIVSEPLYYGLPGPFSVGQNYLEFSDKEQLVGAISKLFADRSMRAELMMKNYMYYNQFIKPEVMILNSLLLIKERIGNYQVGLSRTLS